MRLQQIKIIIEHSLQKISSPLEQRVLHHWLSYLKQQTLPHSNKELESLKKDTWDKIQAHAAFQNHRPKLSTQQYLRYAAVFLAFVFTIVSIYRLLIITEDVVYHTQAQETRTIVLEDHSQITLQQNSKLIVANDFKTAKHRQVTLAEGSGYFQIKSDPQRPFIVSSPTLQTTVLGTKFHINSSSKLHTWKIKVVEGKVAVAKPNVIDSKRTLIAGDVLTYLSAKNQFIWQDNKQQVSRKISFKKNTLTEVVDILAAYYQQAIQLEKHLYNKGAITGEFDISLSCEEILDFICLATHTKQYKSGKTIIIKEIKN